VLLITGPSLARVEHNDRGVSLAHPLRLAEIAANWRDALRDRLPPPQASAWDTARELLRWVSMRWEHSGSAHVGWKDAVHVLDRVDDGERFACREYTIVLSQALNAHGIPTRSVGLMRHHHHTGTGRAHAVSESWIDDLSAWVVMDGQNGMYWVGSDGAPLGLVELRHRPVAGEPCADVVKVGNSSGTPEAWWPYFHTMNPAGVMVSSWPYAPLLERTLIQPFRELRRDVVGSHPDLLELGVGIADLAGKPGIQPVTRHPHAVGFEVSLGGQRWRVASTGEPWSIPSEPGEHTAMLSTVTRYSVHGPRELRYVVR
jgi:Transglutaminase-like superfamily